MPRVVSLLPAATEIVQALGHTSDLVGRSHQCDIAALRYLPAVTRPADAAPSADDAQTDSAGVERSLSRYHVNADLLRELQPDVVLTGPLPDPEHASLSQIADAATDWLGHGLELVSLNARSLDEVHEAIQAVARALDDESAGYQLLNRLQDRKGDLESKALALPIRPTVLCLVDADPPRAPNHWIPELLASASSINMLGDPLGTPEPHVAFEGREWADHRLNWEGLKIANPDVLILMPYGTLEDARNLGRELAQEERWADLGPVKSDHVYVVDGRFFHRPSPRFVEALEILVEIIHPQSFDFGHQGHHWQRWSATAPSHGG